MTVASPATTATARAAAGWPAGPGASPGFGDGRGAWRRWRLPLALAAVVILAGALVALLQPGPPAFGYLDPADTGPYGSHALADLLTQRGATVIRTTTPAAALAAASRPGATIVITSPEYLSRRQLAALAAAGRFVLLVEPDAAALAAAAPRVRLVGGIPVTTTAPDCRLPAAVLAGSADLGGIGMRLRAGTRGGVSCYPVDGLPSLVRYALAGRVVTVLGSGLALANSYLARNGNAALALNLLSPGGRIVWLVPAPAVAAAAGPARAQRPVTGLLPLAVYLVAIQLGVAVLLAAIWRGRRLGPLISERLPVTVRASETVEGHARLYAARRARDRAAAALRTAMLARVLPALGLPPRAAADSVTAALAERSGRSAARIADLIYGRPPGTDAALVRLADDLDALENEVMRQ
jgi:Domain of unknown function (DUF4350)